MTGPTITTPEPVEGRDLIPAQETSPGRNALKSLLEWAVILLGALVAALLIKAFLVQAFFIPSASMEPTLLIGDRVLVNKLSYRLGDVERGDLVVFRRPPNAPPDPSDPNIKDLIKRVVGLPGDTIESRDGALWVNGRRQAETYLPPGTATDGVPRQQVPAGHYWVMGDNRTNSRDSRFFNAIPETLVHGRAFIRIWPFSSLQRL